MRGHAVRYARVLLWVEGVAAGWLQMRSDDEIGGVGCEGGRVKVVAVHTSGSRSSDGKSTTRQGNQLRCDDWPSPEVRSSQAHDFINVMLVDARQSSAGP